MATALARGIVSQGQILSRPQDLMASCPPQDVNLLDPIKELGCTTSHDNLEVVSNSDIVILAVKPAIIARVLTEGKTLLNGSNDTPGLKGNSRHAKYPKLSPRRCNCLFKGQKLPTRRWIIGREDFQGSGTFLHRSSRALD